MHIPYSSWMGGYICGLCAAAVADKPAHTEYHTAVLEGFQNRDREIFGAFEQVNNGFGDLIDLLVKSGVLVRTNKKKAKKRG